MTQYLGISMVVIVIAMCIGVLSTIVSESIFKQMEAHNRRVATRKLEIAQKLMKCFAKYISEYSKSTKEIIEECRKADKEGLQMDKATVNDIFKAAKDAADKAFEETENKE